MRAGDERRIVRQAERTFSHAVSGRKTRREEREAAFPVPAHTHSTYCIHMSAATAYEHSNSRFRNPDLILAPAGNAVRSGMCELTGERERDGEQFCFCWIIARFARRHRHDFSLFLAALFWIPWRTSDILFHPLSFILSPLCSLLLL